MTPARKPARRGSKATKPAAKRTAKKATPPKTSAKKTPARKTSAKKATAKKTTKKAAPRKAAPKKSSAKKTTAKKTTAKKTTATKTAAKKPGAKKTTAKKGQTPRTPPPKAPAARPFVRPAPPTVPKRRTRPASFDAEQLKKIRATLEGKRAELEQRMAELEEDSFDSTQSDITGEVGLDEDFADAGTATFERERDLSIRNNIRDLIDQMTRAVRRIDDGIYGTCERCGNPIDAARLRELPHASLCLDCKRREERAR